MRVQVGGYSVQVWMKRIPPHLSSLLDLSGLSETFDAAGHSEPEDDAFCVSVSPQFQTWPTLFVAQRFAFDVPGFDPGVLVVPETGVVLIGAGERLLAYRLDDPPVRLWEDTTSFGFWWWDRQGEVILMAAECELAAWNLHGQKLWSIWAEPPWSYSLQNGVIQLDVMDNLSAFPLLSGPAQENPT